MKPVPRVAVVLSVLLASSLVVITQDDGELLLGDVRFPHDFHFADLEVECVTCHHESDAARLDVPHEQYFSDFWTHCQTCHGENEHASGPQLCQNCHHASPTDIADETLSAKVVIHRSCWACHEVGTGADASRSCKSCHEGWRQTAASTDEELPS